MQWARALRVYQASGRTRAAEIALVEAMYANLLVLFYLTGIEEMPRDIPKSYAIGSEEEAVVTADYLWQAWEATPGALDWAAEIAVKALKADEGTSGPRLPL